MNLKLTKLRSEYKLIYKKNPDTALRLSALIEFAKIENNTKDIRYKSGKRMQVLALCQGLDISERTLYRWKSAYLKRGIFGLTKKKSKGRPANEVSETEKQHIFAMRTKFRWGAEVIQAHLKHEYGIELTRHKITRYLKLSGLMERYPCTTKKVQRRPKKKHTKVVKIDHPGEHTQMDTKHQPHILRNGKKCYVFNFVDHASNWSFKKAYSSLSPKSTLDFVSELIRICPFEIKRIQTDNGTEYTYKFYKRYADIKKEHPFEVFCKNKGIEHKLIPPGEKELQGLVERSHRQDDQELFTRIQPLEIEEFNRLLKDHFIWRNRKRRFKKLEWKTPWGWLDEYRLTKQKKVLPKLKIGHVTLLPGFDENGVKIEPLSDCKEKEKFDDKIVPKKVA